MSLINNTRFSIIDTGEVLATKYWVDMKGGTAGPYFLTMSDGTDVSSMCEMSGIVPHLEGGKLIFESTTFYLEFSENNVSLFNAVAVTSAQQMLNDFNGFFS